MINNCELDILKNRQSLYKSISYFYNNMYGCSNIGLERNKQEDSILIISHHLNCDFKMVAVADGMGGLENGSLASNLTLYYLINWFNGLPVEYYYNVKNIISEFQNKIEYIDEIIREKCNGGGTTLSVAIKLNSITFTASVGDSRIYIFNKDDFKQINKDSNIAWDLYEKGKILEKDDIRFHKKNNLLLSSVGGKKKNLNIEINNLYNDEYSKLFIFSDGVTDCLPEIELYKVIYSSSDNEVTSNLVTSSLYYTSYNYDLNDDYYKCINGGKDNSSAVMLVKRKD